MTLHIPKFYQCWKIRHARGEEHDRQKSKYISSGMIFLSLFLQAEYGSWSAIRTISGPGVAFIFMLSICWAGKYLNSQSCGEKIIQYVIGYTNLSGAKGKSRQLFSLFVGYFAFSGLPNLPLVDNSTGFFLSLFPLTVGLMGVTYDLIERNCRKYTTKQIEGIETLI